MRVLWRWTRRLLSALRRRVALFLRRPDAPRRLALAIIAMLTGVTTWYRDGGRLSRQKIGDIYCDMARKAVSG